MIPKTNRYLNDQGEFIVRASSLGDIMASPKETKLSAGAITFVKNAFRETYWGYEPDFQSDAMSKGVICEPISIELLSRYYNEPYEKNEETRSNGFVKGTCDIEIIKLIHQDLLIRSYDNCGGGQFDYSGPFQFVAGDNPLTGVNGN